MTIQPEAYPLTENAIFTGSVVTIPNIINTTYTIETFEAEDGTTPYPVPLQITTWGINHDPTYGGKESYKDISDAVAIWGEDDASYDFSDLTKVEVMDGWWDWTPLGDIFINQGSRDKFTMITEQNSKHEFTFHSSLLGCQQFVISFPSLAVPIPEPEGNTVIEKSIEDTDKDNVAEQGETLTYTVDVSNNTEGIAYNVDVRDSLLENLPAYATYNNDLTVNPIDTGFSGDITAGTFVVDQINPGETVTLSYSITLADDLPETLEEIENIVTDNGEDPTECGNGGDGGGMTDGDGDCSIVIIPAKPVIDEPVILKELAEDTNENGIAEDGEELTYTLSVTNPNDEISLTDVNVRDSQLENLPSYLTWDGNVVVTAENPNYTGNFSDGSFTLESIEAGETATISYTLVVSELPESLEEIENIATDNGSDPTECENGGNLTDGDGDCSIVITPAKPTIEEPVEPQNPDTGDKNVVVDVEGNDEDSEVSTEEKEPVEAGEIAHTGSNSILVATTLITILSALMIMKKKL